MSSGNEVTMLLREQWSFFLLIIRVRARPPFLRTARSFTIFKKPLERSHYPILNTIRAFKVEVRNVNLAFAHLRNKKTIYSVVEEASTNTLKLPTRERPPGCTPLYKPYSSVPPQRVWVLRRFGLKTSIDFVAYFE